MAFGSGGGVVATLEKVLADAMLLGLPDLIRLGEAIAAEVSRRQTNPLPAQVDAADVAADAAEDAKFGKGGA